MQIKSNKGTQVINVEKNSAGVSIIVNGRGQKQTVSIFTECVPDVAAAMLDLVPRIGRPATRMEVEMTTAIANLQDELQEARLNIRALLGAPPPRTWNKWPKIYERATDFLKPKPAQIIADGDE
jgi:hypothetical protein